MRDAGYLIDRVQDKFIGSDADTIVVKFEELIAENAVVDPRFIAMEQESISFPRKIIARHTMFFANNKFAVVVVACELKCRSGVTPYPILAEGDFATLKHDRYN